ncbi:hypothetical protein F4678DRAFT_298604 [Xylaria arbuscula]|nr:hypothetical protein F4678DRAFT_298604 [Xylaria arbuscula]
MLTSVSRRLVPPSQTATTSASPKTKIKTAKISDSDFRASILEAHQIKIVYRGEFVDSFYQHLGLAELGMAQDRATRDEQYKQILTLEIWRTSNHNSDLNLRKRYDNMVFSSSNEAEFAACALEKLVIHELQDQDQLMSTDRRLAPVRMLQLFHKPSLPPGQEAAWDIWLAPPQFETVDKKYEWDVHPDCAYYVALEAFPGSVRSELTAYLSVVEERACAPYLTIEFKKNDETIETAENQVATASALALYNRWRLKDMALRAKTTRREDTTRKQKQNPGGPDNADQQLQEGKGGSYWSEVDKRQIRHYGFTFLRSQWTSWKIEPKEYDKWTGCTMTAAKRGNCRRLDDIQHLQSILNDIHGWGMLVHAEACQADIATIISAVAKAEGVSWNSSDNYDQEYINEGPQFKGRKQPNAA